MDDRVLGTVILVGSLLGAACYFWLVFLSPWSLLVIQVSAFAAVVAILVLTAWIGYTLATTPPPVPLGDLDVGGSGTGVGGEKAEETKK